jgi:hypothetical protein
METYFYKCMICGFVHIIPAYWVSYNPETTMEFPHVNHDTKEDCVNPVLQLMKE